MRSLLGRLALATLALVGGAVFDGERFEQRDVSVADGRPGWTRFELGRRAAVGAD